MDTRSLLRPAASFTRSVTLQTTRSYETAARTKRALKIAPHPSFLPDRTTSSPATLLKNGGSAATESIIYNPPSSQASPHHTPYLFLPPNDPRRAALLRMRSLTTSGSVSSPTPSPGPLAKEVTNYKRRSPQDHMTEAKIQEMKRLRLQDPVRWSVNALAKKFECSVVFVKMAAPATRAHKKWVEEKEERRKERWGPMKTKAREERTRRKEMLYRGEL